MSNLPVPLPGNRAVALERARRRMGPLFRDNQVISLETVRAQIGEGAGFRSPGTRS